MANYQNQLQSLGYNYDGKSAGYAKINGFSFIVQILPSSKSYIISAYCKPQDPNFNVELNKYLTQFAADRKKTVNSASFNNNAISISYRMGMSASITEGVKEATDAILFFIGQCGCIPVCPNCGQPTNTDIYSIGGTVASLCPQCFTQAQGNLMDRAREEEAIVTNLPLGIVGAAIGGIAGAAIWILFSMMGRIVPIAGFAAGLGGIFGFKKLGKKLTVSGLIISIIISFAMLLLGMYIATAIDVYTEFKKEFDITFSDSFSIMSQLLNPSSDLSLLVPEAHNQFCGAVAYNCIFGIIAFIVSAILGVVQFFKERKVKNQAIKIA